VKFFAFFSGFEVADLQSLEFVRWTSFISVSVLQGFAI
jgi:hypothetical protein